MKVRPSLLAFALSALFSTTQAAESVKFVSATFQDILSRVAERDATSGAILVVKAKEDSPHRGYNLNFSITRERRGDAVVVLLYWNSKVEDGTYERYRLLVDDAMREELERQEHFQRIASERAEQGRKAHAREIESLDDKLKYGMPFAEVEAIKGKPTKIEVVPRQDRAQAELSVSAAAASHDSVVWFYPDMKIYFTGGTLENLEVPWR